MQKRHKVSGPGDIGPWDYEVWENKSMLGPRMKLQIGRWGAENR